MHRSNQPYTSLITKCTTVIQSYIFIQYKENTILVVSHLYTILVVSLTIPIGHSPIMNQDLNNANIATILEDDDLSTRKDLYESTKKSGGKVRGAWSTFSFSFFCFTFFLYLWVRTPLSVFIFIPQKHLLAYSSYV